MLAPAVPASQSASQLLRPQVRPAASALSIAVDGLLCHPQRQDPTGLRQGGVLELSGPPGIGKTAAAIGLALDARRKALERGDKAAGVLLVGTSSIDYSPTPPAAGPSSDLASRLQIRKAGCHSIGS
jgi:hypothetical protein